MSECIEQQLKQRAAEARANGLPNCADALEAAANEIIGLGDMIDSIATDNERQSAEIEQYRNFVKRVAESGIENNVAWAWIGGQARQLLQTKDAGEKMADEYIEAETEHMRNRESVTEKNSG